MKVRQYRKEALVYEHDRSTATGKAQELIEKNGLFCFTSQVIKNTRQKASLSSIKKELVRNRNVIIVDSIDALKPPYVQYLTNSPLLDNLHAVSKAFPRRQVFINLRPLENRRQGANGYIIDFSEADELYNHWKEMYLFNKENGITFH